MASELDLLDVCRASSGKGTTSTWFSADDMSSKHDYYIILPDSVISINGQEISNEGRHCIRLSSSVVITIEIKKAIKEMKNSSRIGQSKKKRK